MVDNERDPIWVRWNRLDGTERSNFIDHVAMLLDRGYIENPGHRELLDIAMEIWERTEKLKEKVVTADDPLVTLGLGT